MSNPRVLTEDATPATRRAREDTKTKKQLVTIATFGSLTEAYLAKNLLEAEGIQVFLTDEYDPGWDLPIIRPGDSPRLQVPQEQAEQALALLPTRGNVSSD